MTPADALAQLRAAEARHGRPDIAARRAMLARLADTLLARGAVELGEAMRKAG